MIYPLIILGAGASKGSLDLSQLTYQDRQRLEPYTPPITNELFLRKNWERYISNWDEIQDLATDADKGIKWFGNSLEKYLTNLRDVVSKTNPERTRQLLALRFYLATMFNDISNNYFHRANHYRVLLQQIRDYSNGKAAFVNFNYDLLLEMNIPNIREAKSIDDYLSGEIKVFKIHGACNWVHEPIALDEIRSDSPEVNSYVYYVAQAEKFGLDSIPKLYRSIPKNLFQFTKREQNGDHFNSVKHYLPALAIPLLEKNPTYLCPDDHVEKLKEELNRVDRILLIGWRAQDEYLWKLLNEAQFTHLDHRAKLCVVSGNFASASEISARFTNSKLEIITSDANGFGEFLGSGHYVNFWK